MASAAAVLPPPPPSLLSMNISQQQPQPPTTNLTSTLLLPTALSADIPTDKRFKAKLEFASPLLPVDAALLNVLHFMSILAGQHYTQKLAPRTYSFIGYRTVQISSSAWTEPRFLLWGVLFGVDYMVHYARFNEATLELYWHDVSVGRLRIAAARREGGEEIASASATAVGPGLVQAMGGGGGSEDGAKAPLLAFNNSASGAAAITIPPAYHMSFQDIPGAMPVSRNVLFETFYIALIHVAQFPVGGVLRNFESLSPDETLKLSMEELELGCQYSVVIAYLFYVPKYMMENKFFGYKEVRFIISSNGEPICMGTLRKVPARSEGVGLVA